MKEYDIIIPSYNAEHVIPLAVKCLESIARHSRNYRVIWVQNGGVIPGPIATALDKLEDSLVLENEQNLGFVKATNQGLKASTAPFVVLMNNDTEAAPGWLAALRAPLTGRVGATGPVTTARGSWQGREAVIPRRVRIIPPGMMLAFFCVMLRKDVIEKVGLLDETFGVGLGDDDDYSRRIQAAGYQLALVCGLVIPHHHRSTFRALYSQDEIRGMQYRALGILKQKARPL